MWRSSGTYELHRVRLGLQQLQTGVWKLRCAIPSWHLSTWAPGSVWNPRMVGMLPSSHIYLREESVGFQQVLIGVPRKTPSSNQRIKKTLLQRLSEIFSVLVPLLLLIFNLVIWSILQSFPWQLLQLRRTGLDFSTGTLNQVSAVLWDPRWQKISPLKASLSEAFKYLTQSEMLLKLHASASHSKCAFTFSHSWLHLFFFSPILSC